MSNAVIVSCFNLFETRLKPVYKDLSKKYSVTVLTTDYSHTQKSEAEKRYEMCTYLHVPQYKNNISLMRVLSHLSFGRQVNNYLDKLSPELIYVCLPPNNVGNICSKYKQDNPNVKLIIDLIDMWPESFTKGDKIPKFISYKWKSWRDNAISRSDFLITECDYYRQELEPVLMGKKSKTLYLYKSISNEYIEAVHRGINNRGEQLSNGIINLAYLGNINNIIDIDAICNVLNSAIRQGYKPVLHIVGRGNNQDLFLKKATETGCEVIYYGAIYDEIEKANILSCCDYAFNMMRSTVKVGMTIKSMDYFSMGLPIINNIKGDTWELVEKKKIGINISNPNEEVDFRLRCNPERITTIFSELFSLTKFETQIRNIIEEVIG